MTSEELAKQLAVIEDHAPKLRTAGVTSLKLGDIELVLEPAEPPTATFGDDEDEDEPSLSPLDDPATFGKSKVPRRRRIAEETDSD